MEEKKKKNKKIIFIVLAVVIVIAILICLKFILDNHIKSTQYTGTETTQKVEQSKLTEEEKELYKNAVARNDRELLNNKTIETIISEEKERQAEEQRELEEKRAKEEAEKQELANAVTLNVYNKNVIYKDTSAWRFNDFVELKMNCKNNTDKDIIALNGIIKISDLFDNPILNITLLYDTGTIPAKGEVDINDIGLEVNQFMDSNIKVRDTEFSKLKFTFETKSVAFSDGTTIGTN